MTDLAEAPAATPSNPAPDAERRSLLPGVLLALLTAGYALLFGWLSLMRYWAFQMHALDMGNMGQAAWNTVHGHPFYFTNMRLPYAIEAWNTTTRLSFHVEALFPVISLVYLIYPHPESLLVLQTLAIAAGAIPVYLLGRDVIGSRWLALGFATAYLLFPAVEAMNLYEFHAVSLATPLLIFAFWFAWHCRYVPFVLCALAAMGTKEQIGLVVAMFGLWVTIVNRDRLVGLGTTAVGTLWSLFAVLVVERHYRLPGTVTYTKTRYAYLGHGLHGALHTVLHNPGAFFHVIFIWPKLGYVEQLLVPVAFLPLAAPYAILLGAPTLALNLLSQDFHMYSALGDNSAELIAVTMIAGILGARTVIGLLARTLSRGTAVLALGVYLLALVLWNQQANGFAPLSARFQVPSIGTHQRVEARFVGMIPPSVPVSTQDKLDPALSSRRYLYLFPDTGRRPDPPLVPANYILLDASGEIYPLPSDQLHDDAMGYIRRKGWGVAAAQDGLILIRNGASSKTIPPAFYTYMNGEGIRPSHQLQGTDRGIRLLGYDVAKTDLPNHRIPNLAYTFYLRPAQASNSDLQPIVFETVDNRMIKCQDVALGLAWLPTSSWRTGHTYVVRMQPLETDWHMPGTARLYMALQPALHGSAPTCQTLWQQHGRLHGLGSLNISFW